MADTRRSTGLDLMQVSEQILARPTSAVVELPLCKDPQQRALAGVHVPQHCQPQVYELPWFDRFEY